MISLPQSAMSSKSNPRLFSEDWTLTVPSHPGLEFVRLTPSYREIYYAFVANPENTLHLNGPDSQGDEEQLAAARKRQVDRYAASTTKRNTIELLVLLDGKAVGRGGIVEIAPNLANIGIQLGREAQGRGLGRVTMQVLLRMSNEVEVDVIEAGTMKTNKAMRGLAASLGLQETDEQKIVPGRGVVAEVMYKNISVAKWKHYEVNIEFKGPAAEETEK
ncbi:hypothetical protein PVAG01_06943 [Phlyctema vagabunda]|uniref:N-acetyltransferase domain-containing protein n=1 Tax=Phlyctema vagabunda TaxID=108571 RepID=A0ABR4PB03_9HELO